MTFQEPVPFKNEGPQPLVRELPPGKPYPVEALGPLRAAVEAVQSDTQAPMALPAQSALSVVSLIVQPFANVEGPSGEFRPLSLYALTVAKSGERKSTCDAPFLKPVIDHERGALPDYQQAQRQHDNDLTFWTMERDKILRDGKLAKTDEEKAAARADLEAMAPKPTPPVLPERTVTEPTFEGLTRLFAEGQPALGLFSDEGGQFLGGHAMSTDNRTKSLAAFNKLWDGDPIRRTRAGDGSHVLHGRRLALHLMVQPSVATEFMADPKATDTGFMPRFLIAHPQTAIGTRLSHRSVKNRVPLEAFQSRASEILSQNLPLDEQVGGLAPRDLPLSPEARSLLTQYADAVEIQQAQGGDLAHITGWASKSPEQAARIAGVLTLWRDLDAPEVCGLTMADAITLAQHYLTEAQRLADAAMVSAATTKAEKLRQWLIEWPDAEVTVRDIVQKGPNALRETKTARSVCHTLEAAGWLARLPEGTLVHGIARKEAWRIVREGSE